jgi:hypothetical protein
VRFVAFVFVVFFLILFDHSEMVNFFVYVFVNQYVPLSEALVFLSILVALFGVVGVAKFWKMFLFT